MPDHLDSLMTPLEAAVWAFIIQRHTGPENAQPRSAILWRFNSIHPGFGINDRQFRQVVSDLVTRFKKSICTSPSGGYFVARTMKDLDIGVRALESAGAAFFERARSLKETLPLEQQEDLF